MEIFAFLCPAATSFVLGLLSVSGLQIVLRLLLGRRRERPWAWRRVLGQGLDSWKPWLIGLFVGLATLACGFSGVNVEATGPQAQLVPIWIFALGFLAQIALPFVAGMLAAVFGLSAWSGDFSPR